MTAYLLIYVLFWQPREVLTPSKAACERAQQVVLDELKAEKAVCIEWGLP